MATSSNQRYSSQLIEALKTYESPKRLPAIVQKQSIPAGTQVKQGQTVVVTLVSPSEATVGSVSLPNYVAPAEVKKVPIGDIVEVSETPEVEDFLANPSDPVKREKFVQVYNQKLGTSFTTNDVEKLVQLNQNFGIAR